MKDLDIKNKITKQDFKDIVEKSIVVMAEISPSFEFEIPSGRRIVKEHVTDNVFYFREIYEETYVCEGDVCYEIHVAAPQNTSRIEEYVSARKEFDLKTTVDIMSL